MHGADVVQHVAVLQYNAGDYDQEVQAPHHLSKSATAAPPALIAATNMKDRSLPQEGVKEINQGINTALPLL